MSGKLSWQFREPTPEPDSDADDDLENGLPLQADGEYRAFAMPANKPLVSIHFILPDGRVRSFQYRHLDSDTLFDHKTITLRFLGFRPTTVVIEGHNLWRLYDLIHQDRTRWIRQAARDFSEEGQPIVSKLTFIDMTERID